MLTVEIDRRTALGPVRDQGKRPTCLSQATSTVHKYKRGLANPLSAETLHYHATGGDWLRGCTVHELRDALESEGQPEIRHCDPLKPGHLSKWSPPTNVRMYRSKSKQVRGLRSIASSTLRNDKLPVLGLSLPRNFYQPQSPYVITEGNQIEGRHAVTGVGLGLYDGEEVLLIRNSWGDEWADDGHAWLDTAFLDAHLEVVLVLARSANQ